VKDTNIEVHFFRGDPGKGQEPWMYSLRTDAGYKRAAKGGFSLTHAATLAACEIEGIKELYVTPMERHAETLKEHERELRRLKDLLRAHGIEP
jgi:hypothetical protein